MGVKVPLHADQDAGIGIMLNIGGNGKAKKGQWCLNDPVVVGSLLFGLLRQLMIECR